MMVRMETLIGITVFLGSLIYLLRTYCPTVWAFLDSLADVMLYSIHSSSKSSSSDSDIFEDGPSLGVWDCTSVYYDHSHDD